MDITYYKEFIELARKLNFHEAAAALNLSQSALSKHIIALERHYGTQLFDRSTRQVTLTDNGIILFDQALRIWNAYSESVAVLGTNREHEHIRISGLFDSPDEHTTMGRVIALMQNAAASRKIRTVACDSTSPRLLADKLAAENIDCALTYLDEDDFLMWDDHDRFEAVNVARIPLDIVVSSESAIAKRESIRLSELSGASFVHLAGARFTPIWTLIEKRLIAAGIPFTVKPHLATAVYDYADMDLHERILVMPRRENVPEITENPRYSLIKVDDPSFHLNIFAIYRKGDEDAFLQQFLIALKTCYGSRSDPS